MNLSLSRSLRFRTAAFFLVLALQGPANSYAAPAATTIASADLLIVGATEAGWAAAIQAARGGVDSIVIVHDGKWFGGQFTEQALACVDEDKGVGRVGWGVDWHPMKRSFHRSGLFKELMDRIEAFNTQKYGSPMPGRPYHGPSTFRPAEAEAIFREMIAPYIDSGQIRVHWNLYPVAADVRGSRLHGVTFAATDGGEGRLSVEAPLTIDASDWGEVIQVAGAGFLCGPDPKSRFGEPSAPDDLSSHPANEMNPITWAMIVAESDGETPIGRPPRFDDRNYPRATHFSRQAFADLQWDQANPGLGAIPHWPDAGKESPRQLSVYTVRRIVDGSTSRDGKTSILLNYMNGQDYPLERLPAPVVEALEATDKGASTQNIVTMNREQRQIIFDDAKQHALGVLYHLQNFVDQRAPDKTNSFRRFHLSDEFGTPDRLPPKPYIREGLRLQAMYMMREQDGRNRDGVTKNLAKERFAHVMYPDGLFAWQFHYDFHRTGRTYLKSEGNDGPWIDFHKPNRHTNFMSDRSVFPLRSLIPAELDGLIGSQGNVGFSSIVSAAIRLHDQRIHIGQASGAVAVVALREGIDPRAIPYDRALLEAVRHELCDPSTAGVPLLIWPFRDLDPSHEAFVAINRLAALGLLPIDPREVDFAADEPATEAWLAALRERGFESEPSAESEVTRGEICRQFWDQVQQQDWTRFALHRVDDRDADGDGIADRDDPLLFTPNEPIVFQIERPKLDPDSDGIPAVELTSGNAGDLRLIDFRGPGGSPPQGWSTDHGDAFDDERGYGWGRDLRSNHRRRHVYEGPRDTFLFTRKSDLWECTLPNGKYSVTVCVGDSGHDQPGQNVVVEGVPFAEDLSTVAGMFAERTKIVEVRDGRLSVELGKPSASSNTAINWLAIQAIR
ncbi:FAD-dependent oxidoreductase [Rosistilla oblonga]|uniref:FAD-dependent oxidoreductase n=1 Tax=Rosistilla oblonga TaxID=2527990 RepID=UPI003A9721BD